MRCQAAAELTNASSSLICCCCRLFDARQEFNGVQIDSPSKRDPGFSYGASPKTGLDTFRDDTSAGPAPPPRDKSKKKKKKGAKTEPSSSGKARSSRHSASSRRSKKSKKKEKKSSKGGGGDSGGYSPDPNGMTSGYFQKSLQEFFKKHNAGKLGDVPKMAKIYNKKRAKLFDKLSTAYKLSLIHI